LQCSCLNARELVEPLPQTNYANYAAREAVQLQQVATAKKNVNQSPPTINNNVPHVCLHGFHMLGRNRDVVASCDVVSKRILMTSMQVCPLHDTRGGHTCEIVAPARVHMRTAISWHLAAETYLHCIIMQRTEALASLFETEREQTAMRTGRDT